MKAEYFKKNVLFDAGKKVGVQDPVVIVTMNPSEVDKFKRMMKYIKDEFNDKHKYDLIFDGEGVETAWIYVDGDEDGKDFFLRYREAKATVD